MRVLIIAQYFPPDMGGGATRAYNVAKGLLHRDCVVTVVTAFPHYPTGNIPKEYRRKLFSTEYEEGLRVIRTYVPPLASRAIARRILLFISFAVSSLFVLPLIRNVDVVWAANPNIVAVFPSSIYGILKHCPVIQNADDLWPEALYDLGVNKESFLMKLAESSARIAYALASAITPVSPAYVSVIVSKYGVDTRKIHVIPAGVDSDVFSFEKSKEFRKGQKKFKVLYIGAFSLAYDFDQVFRAAELLDSYPDLEFIIQGGGELANALKSRVKEMRLRNVTIVDKIVNRKEVARILAKADVLLLPLSGLGSIEMGISSKLYEYQASGKPIICCSNGQPAQYVSKTRAGVVVDPGDFKNLSKAILYLYTNKDAARALGDAGAQYVKNNLSCEQIGLKMEGVFRFALEHR